MPGVFHSGPNNSTNFTECCSVAICDDQACCPVCKKEIFPRDRNGRFEYAFRNSPHSKKDQK